MIDMARSRKLQVALAIAAVTCASLLMAKGAQANSPITSFAAVPSTAQAAGHPDVLFQFAALNRRNQESNSACNCEDPRDAVFHLPAGFIGNPTTTPLCTMGEFSADECAIDSQVGIVNVKVTIVGSIISFNSAVYNLTPPPDVAALLGFKLFILGTPQFTILAPRTEGDYGLDATTTSLTHGILPLISVKEVLWGVPALRSHDALRVNQAATPQGGSAYGDDLCDGDGIPSTNDPNTVVKPCSTNLSPVASNSPSIPFLQNPGRCEGQAPVSLDILSYDGGTSHAEGKWPALIGCDQLSFNPSLYAQPTAKATDSASGIDINLTVPQQVSPTIPSPSELRATSVTLPPGFSINPNAADGKTACSDFNARFGSRAAAECPEFSKVGTLVIENNSLPGPMPGAIYLSEPKPGDPYRILMVGDGFGVHLKLAGSVVPDPQTGQLTVRFDELPETPLTEFRMHFFGSERALLASPTHCGTFPVTSTFSPWSTGLGSQTSSQFFSLDAGPNGRSCPVIAQPFDPSFVAASKSHSPGVHAPFWLNLARQDGDQALADLRITTPPGFSASLAGIPYCSEAALAHVGDPASLGRTEIAQPSCPAASQVGTAVAGAGAGTHPVYLDGKVYLAGPYKGAPLSLVVVTPAVSGPYDLGNVVVRAAVRVDPSDAHITAVADPLPQILAGIPLRLRSIRVELDRPGFALNPTNCEPMSVEAALAGDEGGAKRVTRHFQVANCRTMPFGPKLALRLGGTSKRLGNPSLKATLSATAGNANIAATKVVLPPALFIDNAHINGPCTRVQFAANACPPSSRIGFARADTPLLDKPLEGPVYLRSAPGRKSGLPDIVAALRGQIDVDIVGHNESAGKGRLRTSFADLPDVPVNRFTLNLEGGRKGLLENSKPLCEKAQVARVELAGQNGKVLTRKTTMRTRCGKSDRGKRAQRAARASR
jgi:hypothetical protein